MQNRYVGDVGDFGKYGLLRALCGSVITDHIPEFRLGIIWCLTPNESHNEDGKHISYLKHSNKHNYISLDKALYSKLSEIINNNMRTVVSIHKSILFASQTEFFDNILTFNDLHYKGPSTLRERLKRRNDW
jgi:hypothetical protein